VLFFSFNFRFLFLLTFIFNIVVFLFLFFSSQHIVRLWSWWSKRADALVAHFEQRRKFNAFGMWKYMWYQQKLLHDSEELADMHYEHSVMRKAFLVWEDLFITKQLEAQLLAGALAWGRRRLVHKCWNAWRDCSKGMFDGVVGS
tara:strand:+ start:127 stop:558 length:432 start_codon:yes stop_codon:yes gene_type:complete